MLNCYLYNTYGPSFWCDGLAHYAFIQGSRNSYTIKEYLEREYVGSSGLKRNNVISIQNYWLIHISITFQGLLNHWIKFLMFLPNWRNIKITTSSMNLKQLIKRIGLIRGKHQRTIIFVTIQHTARHYKKLKVQNIILEGAKLII